MGKTVVNLFELPKMLGILQELTFEKSQYMDIYEGIITVNGCKKGICVRYKVFANSEDGRRWEVKERWRKRRDEESGGCIKQQIADALMELAERSMDVGIWYRKVTEQISRFRQETHTYCGPVINGVEIEYQPQCRSAEECAKLILEEYKNEVKKRSEPPPPPPPDPAEELLKEWPELQTFSIEWVKRWLDLRDRLIEIAKVLRRFPWMADVVRQNPMSILHPYTIVVYVAKDGMETCIQLSTKTFCMRDGKVKETKLELEFKRHEEFEGMIREVYRLKGLFAFADNAKEYVAIL
jgi:hypothetical protein